MAPLLARPVRLFLEDFLEKYDRSTRESRGVYYTPPPIVNFIVRAIDDILKDTFGLPHGLADRERVTVLDFACGTGTFLVEVLERIFANIGGEHSAKADGFVREHMLKNIYGFEYLIAPYTIAHLKLSQYLRDKHHPLKAGERFQVYLTNTLEPIEPQRNALLPELSRETEAAQEVKEKPILVITGNPPYSGHSKNKGKHAKQSIAPYRQMFIRRKDGPEESKPLGERNPKWLQDDYVKFIRFAQLKMDEVDEGVVGIITNHSFLDNPTFRGMRQSLMRSFDQIYVVDLHGNTRRGEKSPDGSPDVNVFDIEQGVAISILIKKAGIEKGVWRTDVWGEQLAKYEWAAARDVASLDWAQVSPRFPMYSYSLRDTAIEDIFYAGEAVPDIFKVGSVGVVTGRDDFLIGIDRQQYQRKIIDFCEADAERARELYCLGNDSDWTIKGAQEDAAELIASGAEPIRIVASPFDTRFTYYSGQTDAFHCRPRADVMKHMLLDNIGLMVSRNDETPGPWDILSVVSAAATHHAVSEKEVNYLYPLWLIRDNNPREDESAQPQLTGLTEEPPATDRIENISPEFRRWIDERYGRTYSPEQVLGYIYAVLHAPAYRSRYADFLRTDFPRIPFPEVAADFEGLSQLGWELVETHLMRSVPDRGLGSPMEQGSNLVEQVRWSEAEEKLWINPKQGFAKVPRRAWDFTIGGYQVLDKYLKSRKGRTLSLEEIEQVERIANVLDFTADQMSLIDERFSAAFAEPGADIRLQAAQ